MNYASVCSGIEAPSAAWEPLGWKPVFFSEIEKFPSAVLAHHYPDVPNYGDMNGFRAWPEAELDVLIGGTPCQSFSVAGLRAGMADPRGNLALVFLGVVDRYRPRWVVWENVPGVLSVDGGRAFGAFLGGLGQLGYGFAYRVLDAQFFGVPQRRRRVFVVGHFGDWRRAAAVLFEPASLRRDPPPSREARERIAGSVMQRIDRGGGLGTDFDCDGGLVPQGCGGETASTINAAFGSKLGLDNQHIDAGAGLFVAHGQRLDMESETFVASGRGYWSESDQGAPLGTEARAVYESSLTVHSLRADGFDASEDGTGRGTPLVAETLRSGGTTPGSHGKRSGTDRETLVFDERQVTSPDHRGDVAPGRESRTLHAHPPTIAFHNRQDPDSSGDVTHPLGAKDNGLGLGQIVRRLMPRECERLQGFPDDYTLIPYRGKPAADGPRYKALGNSMAVPVVRWIGERLNLLEEARKG